MHEMTLVSSIFNVLNDKIREFNVNRVIQVKLMVGDMTGVEDATLRSCFEVYAEATPVEGANLVIEHVPVKGRCRSCGSEFAIRGFNFLCPECENSGVKIISGKELYIDSIEVE